MFYQIQINTCYAVCMHDLRYEALTSLTKIDKEKNPLASPIMDNASSKNTIQHYLYLRHRGVKGSIDDPTL